MRTVKATLSVAVLSTLVACGGGNSGGESPESGVGNVTVQLLAVVGSSAPQRYLGLAAALADCSSAPPEDGPTLNAGLDCDSDGGVVTYTTPTTFKVAFKSLTLLDTADNPVVLIEDSVTLAAATVEDLTTPVQLPLEIPAGSYSAIEAQIYYYELTLPINSLGNVRTIRVYLSDDDFPAEGSLGHHQGDITLVNDGNEVGFAPAGDTWTDPQLQATRGSIEGAGGTDAQTGHARGLYGDAALWNAAPFQQGSGQDIFVFEVGAGFTLAANANVDVTVTFDLQESWYFEDFDGDGVFGPCQGPGPIQDACDPAASWTPQFPAPTVGIAGT